MERSIFNTLPMLFFIYSSEGIYLDVLGGNEKKIVENAKKLVGFHINDVFEENMANFISEKLTEVVSFNKSFSFTYAISIDHFKDKSHTDLLHKPHWFEVNVSPILDEYNKVSKIFWSQFSVQHYKEQLNKLEEEKKELKKLSLQDELTGLYNRRYLYKKLENKLTLIKTNKNLSQSLLSISIDNLKKINSDYGLFDGDKAIEFLAENIFSTFKNIGICTRFREDNFIVILDNLEANKSKELAEDFRKNIESYKSKDFPSFTVSIGITEIRRNDDSIEDILERLEEALFYAKKSGRNKIYTTIM